MFLVILLFLVLVFYPYHEHFADVASIQSLHNDLDDIFKKNTRSLLTDADNYTKLYNDLSNNK